MFKKLIFNGKSCRLYYHQTDGGAEYLSNKFVICPDGRKEGITDGATVLIRVDGGELEIMRM